ncbi:MULTISPECIES: pyrroloquinoline quinone biosynthesis peptide chaperone PqqD [Marinobacter]|uniref:pyrroloquinoline quinone biosynthesis peptide chaperone PqqD n=1 Tax=Marinobacter TaxID=2742 RepID=UPI0019CD820F|nr:MULTISPECIES: pyrroloquinoline quinone biosynthesis peptide chaperone PqqD [Marinobacter]MBD3657964.1 pyrroloquinoline quinone biosynthesis peptide chaperone PqqD [Marinobacter sp.]
MTEAGMKQIPRFRRGFRFQWEPAQNGYVLLYPEGMVKLNESAGAILNEVDGERDVEAIIAALQRRFPEAGDLGPDVREFLRDAGQQHWIEWL